jgi:hypothetical protein
LRASRSGAIDQNLSHRSRRDADEVMAIVPGRSRTRQPEIGFVNEGRWLQRLAGALATHVRRRDPPQLLVDERRQFVRVAGFAARGAAGSLSLQAVGQ